MIKNKSTKIRGFLLAVLILAACQSLIFGRIFANGIGGGYDEPGGEQGSSNEQGNSTISALIEEGAGYYLNANSYLQAFLNRLELSDSNGFDFIEAAQLVDNALANIKNAKTVYEQIIREAENTPYNESFISKLKGFGYLGFMIENKLNQPVFNELSGILETGDLTGLLKQVHAKVTGIEALLTPIKNDLSSGIMPGLKNVWEANERFQLTLLFGQYAARVFFEVK